MDEFNPYQPPISPRADSLRPRSRYTVVATPRGRIGLSTADALASLLQIHGTHGDRLVASCNESVDRVYLVFQSPEEVDIGKRQYFYQVVPAPRAKSLSKTQSGTLTEFMSTHFPGLDAGWVPVAHLSNHQLILTRSEDLRLERRYEEYQIAHVPPVWWRTLVGSTYLRVIGEELNKFASLEYAVITYLGDDRYLLGKRAFGSGSASLPYQLVFIGNLLRAIFLGYASACNKRLAQMSEQGWELVTCNYSNLLFKQADASSHSLH